MIKVYRFLIKSTYNAKVIMNQTVFYKVCRTGHQYSGQKFLSTAIRQSYFNNDNKVKITPLGWFLLTVPITTFGLGCWQIKRKSWKEQLIKSLEELTKSSPIDMPENLTSLNDVEYRSVKVRGEFLHSREVYIGPRSLIRSHLIENSDLVSNQDTRNGCYVITPFKLANRDDIILINRGWIPRQNMNPATRQSGQIAGEVELTGIIRKTEQRPIFSPGHSGNLFLYRDLEKICDFTGAQPIFLDATYDSTIAGGPIGGQTHLFVRNEHLSYIITWFSLSLSTAFLWYRSALKGKAI